MNILKIAIIALLLFALGTSSCKKDDKPVTNISTIVQQGTWRVTFKNDGSTDETYHFSGYVFTFNPSGTIVAVKDSSTMNGIWVTKTDDNQQEMYLNFGKSSPFDELNDDWRILEQTTTKIRLDDVSGGNGGTDFLTFERN